MAKNPIFKPAGFPTSRFIGTFAYMMKNRILIKNIKQLVNVRDEGILKVAGKDMTDLPSIQNAYLVVEGEKIASFGKMEEAGYNENEFDRVIDAGGKMVFPAWCDSHTHLVFPKTREIEYIDKIKGLSYEEIAKRGGGILNSARMMREASEEQLYEDAMQRIDEIVTYGTGAVEIKSGYGLETEAEMKMLRVIRKLKENSDVEIKATFLGAHSIPPEYKSDPDEYVDIVINEMIPRVAGEDLADYIDVFCDRGFFSVEQTDRILMAGLKHGLIPKIHANELDYSGGIQVGVKYDALSVDHLEYTGDEEIETLLNSETMPTVLPGAAFFLGMIYAPVRKMIDAGLPLCLASDFNPGSSPSGNMQLILSMGSILYRLLPEEGINACTLNGAYAMGLAEDMGSITKGKTASLFITKEIPTYEFMPYYYGSNKVDSVILKGKIVKQ